MIIRADHRTRPGTYAYIAAPPFDAFIAIFTKKSNYIMLISVIMSVTLFVNIIEYKIHMRTNDGTMYHIKWRITNREKEKKEKENQHTNFRTGITNQNLFVE